MLAGTLPLRADDSPFTVDSWTTEDDLPQSSVISIVQTHDGYLWLGTLNGLVRFDGNSFHPFNVNNTPGLPGDRIVFLFEDSRNILWVCTGNGGLCAIQNGVVKNFDIRAVGGRVLGAFEAGDGIWFVTDQLKLLCWQNGQMAQQAMPQDKFLAYLALHMIVPEKSGSNWQLQNGRVQKLNGDKMEKDFGPSPWAKPNSWISATLPTAGGSYLSISYDANVTAACEDPDGNLVVGTYDGIYWFDADGHFQHLTTREGLSGSTVLSLCFDHDGNLWAGMDSGGLDRGGLDRIRKNNFTSPAGFSGRVARSVTEDALGGYWGAFSGGGGLTYSLTNSAQHFRIGNYGNAWSVLADRRGQVWAGTYGEGLFQLVSTNFLLVSLGVNIGPQINALFQSHDGKIWVGGQNGLGSFDGQNWNFYTTNDRLPPNPIRAIAEATNGDILIGTESAGLFLLRDGEITSKTAPVKDISCLLVGHDNTLWVGTAGHGLARLAQRGGWTTYATTNGLAGDDIGYLIEDGLGNLWIGSYEGLMRVSELSLADTAADSNKKISCRIFLTRECSAGAQPAALRAQDGKLWFPTIQGIVAVDPADLKTDTNPPPVIIESVLVNGVAQKDNSLNSLWTQPVTLAPGNQQLEIHFTALNFSAPKHAQLAVRFKYSLDEGRGENYLDIGGERQVRFNKLPPGDYHFHVIACNEDGFWNDTGARLEIIVQPPFWRKPWFVATSLLVFLGILAGTIYLISTAKLKRELRALHQKELIERERARIARDLHDQLGANLTQVTLLGEMAEADKHLPDEIEQHAQQICATARETTRSLDEIVWAVNPSNDTLEGLANYACKYAQDYFALANVSFHADLPADLPATPILPEVRHNVFLAFKEAVNNVVKHAQATRARVWLRLEPAEFILGVEDNGRGPGDVSAKTLRNGLKNMNKRLADVHGQFEIAPGPNGGTIVRLIVPLKK